MRDIGIKQILEVLKDMTEVYYGLMESTNIVSGREIRGVYFILLDFIGSPT